MSKKENIYPILMGDVVSSSSYKAEKLHTELKELVEVTNMTFRKNILSPLTITLGDEFQGVVDSLQSAVQIIFLLEEESLRRELNFRLHYVFHTGKIETDINPDIAYEMLGSGLTHARKLLTDKSRDRKRFVFDMGKNSLSEQLIRIFDVVDGLTQNWKKEDFKLIWSMIKNENNQEVGDEFDKNRDQIWKRRKTLMIKEYTQLKDFIFTYTDQL